MNLLILADDLTGAADSAARCHNAGLTAHVYLQPPSPPLPPGVVALSTDSRFLPAAEAAQRVRDTVAPLLGNPLVWYKKIDSTLRGNLGAELDVLLEIVTPAGQPACAVICPAFPAQGRGLEDGYLVHPQTAPRTLHLPTLLAEQTQQPLAALTLTAVRAGVERLSETMAAATAQGAKVLVVDALDEADLETVLTATQRSLPPALLCGSAGLIEPLARTLVQPGASSTPQTTLPLQLPQPVLAVVGSGSAMAHRQIEALRAASKVDIFDLDEVWVRRGGEQAIGGQHGWVIHLPKPTPQTVLEGPAARALATRLAEAALHLIMRGRPRTLILVGGDTALHVLERLGIERLTVLTELMPGIPLLRGVDQTGGERLIITKAGNFGDEGTLIQLLALAWCGFSRGVR